MKSYDKFRMKLKKYPYDSINTCTEYYNLFKKLKKNQRSIILNRKITKLSFIDNLKIVLRKN